MPTPEARDRRNPATTVQGEHFSLRLFLSFSPFLICDLCIDFHYVGHILLVWTCVDVGHGRGLDMVVISCWKYDGFVF